jgi:hypothetical protein
MRLTSALSVILTLCLGGPAIHAVSITVTPALAPNGFGSPSFDTWLGNAIYALEHGWSSYGVAGTPGYYQAASSTIDGDEILVTSFPSWRGLVDPGTAFGPAFAGEYGNRLHFGLVIDGEGTQFSISQLSFTATSTDPFDALGFSFAEGSYTYSSSYVGVLYGADGALGGGDDTYVTSGPNTTLVDALIGRGSGNAYWPCGPGDPLPCTTDAERQLAMNVAAAYPGFAYDFIGTYTLSLALASVTGSATVHISPVPEPATLGLLGVGLAALAGVLRRQAT